jgi:hypothetical protein
MKNFVMRIKSDSVLGKAVYFDDIKKIEDVADKLLGWGPTDVLGRTAFEKKKGRMTKTGPVVDVWECRDMLCTARFKILAVATKDLPKGNRP